MAVRVRKQSEADRQKAGVDLLRSLGYTVLESGKSRSKVKCKRCGHEDWATGWQGNSVGLPDTMVTHPSWGKIWMMAEWKVPGGPVRKEQQDLIDAGHSTIVMTDIELLRLVKEFEIRCFGDVNPKIRKMEQQLTYA